mmetsp:Transcript_10355/g.15908  ORF Transcript_10355/g.15908 Transcript_10355/m.15908 type:complete len:227 (-) Transcript_10355:698-1378(-)
MMILSGRLNQLRLEVLEFHGRNEEAYFPIPVSRRGLVLVSLVVNGCGDHGEHRENSQLLHLQVVHIAMEHDLSHSVDVVAQALVEEQGFRILELVEVLQQRFNLGLKQVVEGLGLIRLFDLGQLLHALSEEPELLQDFLEHLYVLVVDWLVQQVIEVEAAGDDEHEALIKLGRDVEKQLVIILDVEAVVLDVEDHARLLVVEELPDLVNRLQVIASNLVEVTLLGR